MKDKETEKKELELSALLLIVDGLRKENEQMQAKIKAKKMLLNSYEIERMRLEAQITELTRHNTELQTKINQREDKPVWD